MEAVPKLPMLSFELKISPVCPDFAAPFKRYITKYYGEDGDLYGREIIELETLRNNACRTARDFTGCSLLKRYYAQIYSLYNRLVVFESQIGVQCVWADIYTGQTNIGDLDFELACILYNIGALHAELGATDSRQTAEEMKVSCTHFQCAAWAFQHMMEDAKLFRSSDMSNDVLSFFVQIMLAQAQECILEKSMLDNRKASIVAKVAAQVVEYYKSAIVMLQQGAMNTSSASSIVEVVGSKLFKEWKKFVEFKLTYYGAICHLYMGNLCEEQQKMGERVSWYDSADAKMKEVVKLAKQLDSHVNVEEAIIFVADVITVKLSNAKKENDFIYHEKVLPVESLSEIKGASLVKGIPFSITDPEICGQDIFARLVPIEAHETASLYSARKDEILRNIRGEIDNRNQELVAYLSSLQLDRDTLRTPREDAIPDELIDICAELSLNPDAVDEVEKTLTQLDLICEETDKTITESKELLSEEEEKEQKHQEKFGKRPPSLILVELSKELTKHQETHNKAIQSNRSLWENFDQHKDDIRVMTSSSASKIASILPSNKDISFDEETVMEMERLFDKVEEMKKQRMMLEEKLIKDMDTDNVLKLVLAHSKKEIDAVFEREIKKYDQTVDIIKQNLGAQDNILRALTNCNARYAETRKAIIEIQRNRKTRIASLMYTFQVFKELKTNSKKGLEFYDKFQGIVTRLNARIRGVSKVQDEERTQFVIAHSKKLAAASGVGSPMVPGMMGVGAAAGAFGGLNPGLASQNMPSTASPPIPSTGAKLKDFLPYMNQNKNIPSPVAGNAAIPVASYLTSTPSSATIGPLSQNYPPPSMTPQSQFAPSAPIPCSTPLSSTGYASPAPPLSQPVPPSPVPQVYMQQPPSAHQQPPHSSYGYLSPQAGVSQTNSSQLDYSPPPSYAQAIATTVSYSLPAIISTISPMTSITTSPIRPPAQPNPYQSQYGQFNQQQPISSVLPIHQQQQQHLLPNSSYANSGTGQMLQPHNQQNYAPSPLGSTTQQTNMTTAMYGNTNYPNQSIPMAGQGGNVSNSYYYPAPVISSGNQQPNVPGQVAPVRPAQPNLAPMYQTPSSGHLQQSQTYIPQANSSYPRYQTQSSTNQSVYYSSGATTGSYATSAVQQQQQFQQPNVPTASVYPGSMVPQAPLQQQSYQVPNGTQYMPQQAIPQNAAQNSVAATIQAIEIESKGGWPVMMPTRMDQTPQLGQAATVPPVYNGTTSNDQPSRQAGVSSADQLPDILATMSITNNVSQSSNVLSVDNSCKPLPSPATAAAAVSASVTSNGTSEGQSGEPKELLSEFDPLFT